MRYPQLVSLRLNLGAFLARYGIRPTELVEESGEDPAIVHTLARKPTYRVDLRAVSVILDALTRIVGQRVELSDLIEDVPDPDAPDDTALSHPDDHPVHPGGPAPRLTLGERDEGETPVREYQALLLLKEGASLKEIAARLPRLRHGQPSSLGVSDSLRDALVAAGFRKLAAQVHRGERHSAVPPELWPPQEVWEAVRAEGGGKASIAILRAWIRECRVASRAGVDHPTGPLGLSAESD